MDRSSILCTMEQRKLPSSSSSKRRSYHYHSNNNGATTTNMMKKKKEGPMKVVYISNPVRFKVTASEFRSLVQELTGQDSEDVPTHHQFQFNDASSCTTQLINKGGRELFGEEEDKGREQVHHHHQATTTTTTEEDDDPFGILNDDDVFTPLENLSDLLFPSSAFLVL